MKLLFLIIFLSVYSGIRSQNPELFENSWYIQSISINGTIYTPLPEFFSSELVIDPIEAMVYHPYCKDAYGTQVHYENLDIFNLDDNPLLLPGVCTEPSILEFMDRHYSIYFVGSSTAKNPFNYIINEDGGNGRELIVTNSEGNTAVYGDQILSTPDIASPKLLIYPNPVTNKLYFKIENFQYLKIEIFNLSGQLILKTFSKSDLDVSSLSSGIYILKSQLNDAVSFYKIVKM